MSMEVSRQEKQNRSCPKGRDVYTHQHSDLIDPDLDALSHQLEEKIKQAPNFFTLCTSHYRFTAINAHPSIF